MKKCEQKLNNWIILRKDKKNETEEISKIKLFFSEDLNSY